MHKSNNVRKDSQTSLSPASKACINLHQSWSMKVDHYHLSVCCDFFSRCHCIARANIVERDISRTDNHRLLLDLFFRYRGGHWGTEFHPSSAKFAISVNSANSANFTTYFTYDIHSAISEKSANSANSANSTNSTTYFTKNIPSAISAKSANSANSATSDIFKT